MYTVLLDDSGQRTKKLNIQTGFHFREAYRFALKRVNERQILYGMNLSEEIMSAEGKIDHDQILYSFYIGNPKPVVSPTEPYTAFDVSVLTEALRNPLITYGYSNDRVKHPTFIFRATAADNYKLSAMVAIVKKLRWNYISVLSSNGKSGETLSKAFIKHAFRAKICSAKNVALPSEPTLTDYRNAIREVASVPATALVLFTNNRDSIGLAMAMKELLIKGKFQILAMGGFTNYNEVVKGNEDYLQGAISIEQSSEELSEFKDHFLALKLDRSDSGFVAFWEETFSCKFKTNSTSRKCTGTEKIRSGLGYYPLTPINPIINSVFVLAYAAKSFMKRECSKSLASPPCSIKQLANRAEKERYFNYLREFLLNNSFPDYTLNLTDPVTRHDPSTVKFDIFNYVKEGGTFVSRKIGSWAHHREESNFSGYYKDIFRLHDGVLTLNISKIRWTNSTGLALSSCRLPCLDGEVSVPHPDSQKSRCCWSCVKCGPNMISVNNTCLDCGMDFKPGPAKKYCIALGIRHFSIDEESNKSAWAYIGLSAFGILSTVFVIITFKKHEDNVVVRSSGRELCYVMLSGICLLFLMPITFLAAPSGTVCSIRYLLPGIAFCICYSPLFLKINRIYRIFMNAQSTTAKPLMTSPKSQLFMVACFVSVQLLLGVVWIVSEVPRPVKVYHKADGYVMHSCSSEALPLVLNLALSVGLMCCCTWYAFKTRNFPKNYNESKYIGFTMYITSVCWALFLPTYFLSKSNNTHIHEHLTCVLVTAVAFVSLVGLFGQRMLVLLMPTRVQQQQQFSQCSRREADPNQFQMKTYSLRNLTLPRTNDKGSIHINSRADIK